MHYLIFKVNYNVLNYNRLAIQMEDSYIHQGLRKKLIEKLVYRGIRDEKVLSAIDNVPRPVSYTHLTLPTKDSV